ncbi:hypothetical protein KIW84_020209 [Lathyrus oleraceus]|uniref:Uncharacterized protein n=1 Tax=Pisum sativum TaxID=3888 RepID=A0A9D4Y906_PEA|nr:hypothetical protein KIW84_020209 [Pisum sativum]
MIHSMARNLIKLNRIVLPSNQLCRIPDDSSPRRHFLNHNRTSTDFRTFTDLNIPQNTSPRTNQHPVANLRMPIAMRLTSPSQRHTMQNRHIISNHSRFSDHDPRRVIEQNSTSELRSRMNVNSENFTNSILNYNSQNLPSICPQIMSYPMSLTC